jgi:hypothetical protein
VFTAAVLNPFPWGGAHDLTDLDSHIERGTTRPGRSRGRGRDFIRPLWAGDADDPVAGKEFLGFRKHTVGDRRSAFARANQLCLIGVGQALNAHEFTRRAELAVELPQELDVRFDILLRPG